MALQGATEACVSGRGQEDCLSAIERRKEELLQKSDCYADIPRDVFICHSSVDSAKARRVAAVLEEDGNQCWISSRNLPPDAPDYWARIERAIQRCRVFLVLCSEASMLSKDVQRELGIAEKTGNARLEIKLDSKPHTTQFRYFFDGVTWIDATGGIEGALTQAKQRVFAVLHAKGAPFPGKHPAPSRKICAGHGMAAGGHAPGRWSKRTNGPFSGQQRKLAYGEPDEIFPALPSKKKRRLGKTLYLQTGQQVPH